MSDVTDRGKQTRVSRDADAVVAVLVVLEAADETAIIELGGDAICEWLGCLDRGETKWLRDQRRK